MRRAARISAREAFRACTAAWLLAACSVYESGLLDDAGAAVSVGGGGAGEAPEPSGGTNAGNTAGKSAGGAGVIPSGGTAGGLDDSGEAGEGNHSGSGGSVVTAGSSTGGAAGGAAGGGGTVPGDLLDGFEDGDLILEQSAGRGGVWYLFDDGSVGMTGPSPLAPTQLEDAPPSLGDYALHVTATGFTGWGSGLGVDFKAGKKPYDASKLSGVRFWARVSEGANTRHRLQLVDATTDALGGKCNPALDAPVGEKCDDHFGKNFTFTTSWALYVVSFDELSQIGWGKAAPALDKATLYGLQLTAKPKLTVDVWLDQIEFF